MVDHPRVERAVRELLIGLGYDPNAAALLDTPVRVARAWEESLAAKQLRALLKLTPTP